MQPLVPLVAAPVADPLSAVALARLVLWRQVYARWPVHLLVALVVATSWLTPERWQPGAGLFALVGVVAYALVLGLGPAAREELFWQGLGGAPGVRQGTALLLEFGLVGAALLAVRGVELKQMLWTLGISVCILALAGFSRSWAVSWAGRLLVCVGTLLVGLLTLLPSWWISKWPLLFGAELRLGVLVGGAVLLRLLLAARRPASAAGRKLRGWGWTLLPLSTAAFLVVEGAWPV
ncbi:MAG: hypothetical protein GXP62_20955, partial [Oligoflexia bacterium]|nr:hypothetical protein [Oligoflexia bacterium]